jgi:hypothetical protein
LFILAGLVDDFVDAFLFRQVHAHVSQREEAGSCRRNRPGWSPGAPVDQDASWMSLGRPKSIRASMAARIVAR